MVDCNGLQGFGSTLEVASMDVKKLKKLFSAFDFDICEIDAHSEEELKKSLLKESNKPQIILMNSCKGKGISFMENQMQWHYLPLTEELYQKAKMEIESL